MRHGSVLAVVLILLLTGPLRAHPIAPQHHDRQLLVRITDDAVLVEYALALDSRTLIQDLFPFRDVDFSGGEASLTERYGQLYGPLIAHGLVASIDNQELEFRCARVEFKPEVDHYRYIFHLNAGFNSAGGTKQQFRLTDSSFATQPGVFKLAVRSAGRVEVLDSTVEPNLVRAREHLLRGFSEREEQLRSASGTFLVRPELQPAPPAEPPPVPVPTKEAPTLGSLLQSQSLHRLLDSDLGLGLLLLAAFVFGAFHALQPGHGKTLVAAYLVGERGTILHAFYLGLVTTITHTGVVILLALVVPLVFPEAESDVTFALSLGCGLLVVLMACWLLLRRLAGQADHVHLFGGHHHHGPDGHHHHHLPEMPRGSLAAKFGWGALTLLGITGGLVPCVDALALLAATWVQRQLWLGLPLTLAFSLGLASVLVAIGVAVVKFKQFAGSRWGGGWFVRSLPIVSALLTLALGLWMCHEALQVHERFATATGQP